MKLLQFPLTKIVLFFISGIVVAHYFHFSFLWINCILLFLFISLIFSYLKNKNKLFYKNHYGIIAVIISFFIGIATQIIHTDTIEKEHFTHYVNDEKQEYSVIVVLSEKLRESLTNERFVAQVRLLDNQKSCGKLIVNILKDSLSDDFEVGDALKLNCKIYKNKYNTNPVAFDYGKYLDNKQIYAQIYCNFQSLKIVRNFNKDIWYHTAEFRNRIIKNLRKNNFSGQELAVVEALVLGQQQDISNAVLQDYQFAGAIHILSVSGLHVGLIMMFVNFVLMRISNNQKGKILKLFLTLLSLWSFGFVAGLAPSILRSVVMFSFIAFGKYLDKITNVFHTLLISMFVILVFEPSFLFDVGFQLSYTAVFAILWLEPLFTGFWTPKYKVLNYFWKIITVSFAAQIGAMPLSIYYFHQFPCLFFVTNLVILWFVGLILGIGILVMVLAYFDAAPLLFVKLLEFLVKILNQFISWIANFETFVVQDIAMNLLMLFSLYLFLVTFFVWIEKPSFGKLKINLSTLIIYQMVCLGTKYITQTESELVVMNVKKSSVIVEKLGQNATIYTNEIFDKNDYPSKLIQSFLTENFSQERVRDSLHNLLYFKSNKILVLDSLAVYHADIQPDILIITHSPKVNFDRFLQICRPKRVVADASNYGTNINLWKQSCQKLNIPFFATTENGFYKL